MKAPCENIVMAFLPFIRSYVANRLITEHGYTQTDAARAMGISQPAISLYLKGKRGLKLDKEGLPKAIPMELDSFIDDIVKEIRGGNDLSCFKDAICRVCPLYAHKLRTEKNK